jgi:hypothetical protein
VDALASRMPVPVEIDVSVGRLPAAVEATAYFVVAEALTNIAKHARAGRAEVIARIEHGTLAVHVRDDGVGGARPDGSGLLGLADRLAALDGKLRVDSPADSGTLVAAAIPSPASSCVQATAGAAARARKHPATHLADAFMTSTLRASVDSTERALLLRLRLLATTRSGQRAPLLRAMRV